MPMNPRLLRPTASGFNPASISGLVHWWDANDASTVLLNSGQVESWTSKGGSKTVASQSVANNRPTTTTVNGKTALLFDGSNDGLDFTGTARTDETWILVAEQTENQSGTRALINDGTDGGGITTVPVGGNRALRGEYATGVPSGATEGVARLTVLAGSGSVAMPPLVIAQPRSAANGIQIRLNGTQRVSSVTGGLFSSSTSGNVNIARIGYALSTVFQFKGWIGEIMCWNRVLTVAEMQRAERYLGRKWGITVA